MSQPTLSEQTRQTLEAFVANLPEDQQQIVGKAFEALMASDTGANAVKPGDNAPK